MTNKQAIIFSEDMRFKRMLELELLSIGVNVISDTMENDGELFFIVDLDGELPKEIFWGEKSTVIGYSKRDRENISEGIHICDSFLKRPFPIGELFAVLGFDNPKNIIRQPISKKPEFNAKRLTLDNENKAALFGDTVIPLSDNEFEVLSALCKRRGQPVERQELDLLLGTPDSNMGDVYICHLRKKIDNHLGLKLIYTVRGKGYMLKN